MTDEGKLEACLRQVRDLHLQWDWFLTLKYPYRSMERWNPEDSFMQWIHEIGSAYRDGGLPPYVRVIEKRTNGDLLFHILLQSVPDEKQRYWRFRWHEISDGAAWDRNLSPEIDRLFQYLVRRAGCDIEALIGSRLTAYEQRDRGRE